MVSVLFALGEVNFRGTIVVVAVLFLSQSPLTMSHEMETLKRVHEDLKRSFRTGVTR